MAISPEILKYLKQIGRNVKAIRIKRKMPIAAIAEAVDIPPETYKAFEAGRYDPDIKELFRLAEVLKVHPKELVKDVK